MRLAEPLTMRRPCPSCAPGLPMCVSCYLDMRDMERLEDERLIDLEGYVEHA